MALIKCPNCNHEITNTVKKCIHCGQKIPKNNRFQNSIDKIKNVFNKINKKCITNILFTLGFIILLYCFQTVITKHSGIFTIMNFINWLTKTYIHYILVALVNIVIIAYLIFRTIYNLL